MRCSSQALSIGVWVLRPKSTLIRLLSVEIVIGLLFRDMTDQAISQQVVLRWCVIQVLTCDLLALVLDLLLGILLYGDIRLGLGVVDGLHLCLGQFFGRADLAPLRLIRDESLTRHRHCLLRGLILLVGDCLGSR